MTLKFTRQRETFAAGAQEIEIKIHSWEGPKIAPGRRGGARAGRHRVEAYAFVMQRCRNRGVKQSDGLCFRVAHWWRLKMIDVHVPPARVTQPERPAMVGNEESARAIIMDVLSRYGRLRLEPATSPPV